MNLVEAVDKAKAELGEMADSIKLLERAKQIAAAAAVPAEWWVSKDEESFQAGSWKTREEAIAAAPEELELEPGETFFTGRQVPAAGFGPAARHIIENAQEQAFEECGDVAEDWLDHPDEWPPGEAERDLQTRLTAVWIGWLRRYRLEPTFFSVADVESHQVPAALPSCAGADMMPIEKESAP